ncbi:hypothetical protein K439DRAFT_1624470 [Ramaria rubella]|nr:hypothetical protein K439DRAFT_1624470 [Ramaria rubella]
MDGIQGGMEHSPSSSRPFDQPVSLAAPEVDFESVIQDNYMDLDAPHSSMHESHSDKVHMCHGGWWMPLPTKSLFIEPNGDLEALFNTEGDEVPPALGKSLLWAYDAPGVFKPPNTPSGYSSEISSPAAPGPDGIYSQDRMGSDSGTECAFDPQPPAAVFP